MKRLNIKNNMYKMPYYGRSCNDNNTTPTPTPPTPRQPIVTDDPNYLQGYLKSLIGKFLNVEFIIGTNLFIDKAGILKEVGVDYITLEEPQGNLVIADLYSIKFIDAPETNGVNFTPNNYRR